MQERLSAAFVGRSEELAILLGGLDGNGPLVVHIYGVAGIGKSALLGAFAEEARQAGATVVRLDCRIIEPSKSGFLRELGAAIGGGTASEEDVAGRLGKLGERVVLALDTFELFRMADGWLRQDFVPRLPDNVRLVLASREPPVSAWWTTPGWQGLFRAVSLGPLPQAEAKELLVRLGVMPDAAARIIRIVRGHPLGLTVAAAAWSEWSTVELEEEAIQRAVDELTRLYLSDLDPVTRRVLHAASLVRRTTLPLLGAMLQDMAPQDAFERLRGLPFVEATPDGLMLHEAVQQVVAASLRAEDPAAHRAYRQAAWRLLRAELRGAAPSELWRYTADTLYLLENPAVREAFFPTTAHLYSVEPARAEDATAIEEITRRHEQRESAEHLISWWHRLPQVFRVMRDREGEVAGYQIVFRLDEVPLGWIKQDPVTLAWWEHLRRHPVPAHQIALCQRRFLDREEGELPSGVQAAAWLDIKRLYLEMRPLLRRVYGGVQTLEVYGPALTQLGFEPVVREPVSLDGVNFYPLFLDFGPSSIDGWLSWLVSSELDVGEDDGRLLDVASHQLVLDGQRVQLTPREFEVLHYLYERAGHPVNRYELLRDVWGYESEVGSNVVDATIRSIRRKLGSQAGMVETLRGVGYRATLDIEA
jgi:DNA-binding response OmpR family regulator